VQKCSGPKLGGKARAIEEGTCANTKFVVINFNCTTLQWAVKFGGFNSVVKVTQNNIMKQITLCQLDPLVRPNAVVIIKVVFLEKCRDNFDGWFFRFSEEDPDVAASLSTIKRYEENPL
jgi:hypothetical protein